MVILSEGLVTSDLLGLGSDWFEYPLLVLFIAWAIWRRAIKLASIFGLGVLAWAGLSSARAYADHGDPYLALLSGVNELFEQIRQIWN